MTQAIILARIIVQYIFWCPYKFLILIKVQLLAKNHQYYFLSSNQWNILMIVSLYHHIYLALIMWHLGSKGVTQIKTEIVVYALDHLYLQIFSSYLQLTTQTLYEKRQYCVFLLKMIYPFLCVL